MTQLPPGQGAGAVVCGLGAADFASIQHIPEQMENDAQQHKGLQAELLRAQLP